MSGLSSAFLFGVVSVLAGTELQVMGAGVDPAVEAAKLFEREELVWRALRGYPAALDEVLSFDKDLSPAERHGAACGMLDRKYGREAGTFAREMPATAAVVLAQKEGDAYDRGCALLVTQKYGDAEIAATAAVKAIPETAADAKARRLAALEAAGMGASGGTIHVRALQHFEDAAALTDAARDIAEWRRLHRAVASGLMKLDRAKEAEPVLSKVLKQYAATRGTEHPETADCREDVAFLLRDLNRAAEAEAELRKVITVRERVAGPDDARTLRALHALVPVLHQQGKVAEAESFARKEYGGRVRVQGAEHRDTLECRNDIIVCMRAQGHGEAAEKEYRALLADCERILGGEDTLTLDVRYNLAMAHRDMGRKEEGLIEVRSVLAVHERTRGADHPLTVRTRAALIEVLEGMGREAETEAEYRKQVSSLGRAKGENHLDTLSEKYKLAKVLYQQKQYDEAETLFAAMVATPGNRPGPEGELTVKSYSLYAVSLLAHGDAAAAKGDAKRARELWAQALSQAKAGKEAVGKVYPGGSPTAANLDLLTGIIGDKLKEAGGK